MRSVKMLEGCAFPLSFDLLGNLSAPFVQSLNSLQIGVSIISVYFHVQQNGHKNWLAKFTSVSKKTHLHVNFCPTFESNFLKRMCLPMNNKSRLVTGSIGSHVDYHLLGGYHQCTVTFLMPHHWRILGGRVRPSRTARNFVDFMQFIHMLAHPRTVGAPPMGNPGSAPVIFCPI